MNPLFLAVLVAAAPRPAAALTLEEGLSQAKAAAAAPSPLRPDPKALSEAAALLQGTTRDGVLSPAKLRQVARELAAIRALSAAARDNHPFGDQRFDSLELELTTKLAVQLGPKILRGAPLPPTATGSSALDRALAKLGAKSLTIKEKDDEFAARVEFRYPVDLGAAEETLSKAGLRTPDRGGLMRIGTPRRSIHRFEKDGAAEYAFGDAGPNADCMAGCMQQFLYFKVVDGAASEVRPSRPWMSVYGFPERYPARAFGDYAELLAALSDPDWSVRLHAAACLRTILENRATGLGEDDFPAEGPAEKARVKAIFDAVAADERNASEKLAGVTKNDPDPDVRRAAEFGRSGY